MSPASLGIVCFRRRGREGDTEEELARRNAALVAAFERTGQGLVSSTRLHGRYAIRLCVMNHTSGEEHVRGVLDWFAAADESLVGAEPSPEARPSPRRAEIDDDRWVAAEAFSPDELARLRLFAGVGRDELGRVATWAREQVAKPGEVITRRWDVARDFYVVVEGEAYAERDGEVVARFEPGDFFGELAALDWGAGYGYTRMATVTATTALRLLVLSPSHLGRLMAEAPSVDELIRAVVRERLGEAAP